MPKICPKSKKEWPDDFMACPLDGTALISTPQHILMQSISIRPLQQLKLLSLD
jgi:hypothetical protein